MSALIFALSFTLLVAGAASGFQSVDLLPTSIGVLYALAGAVAVCAAVVTFAIAVAIRRIDALAKLLQQPAEPSALLGPLDMTSATGTAPVAPIEAGAPESGNGGAAAEDDSPININRTGHLPSLEAIETALETPEEPQGPPSLIGSYSSAGANYKIFADGSIEAETGDGTFKFASMSDFKRHLLGTKGAKAAPANE
jgi:hypothetical protein